MQRTERRTGIADMQKKWAWLILPVGAAVAGGWFVSQGDIGAHDAGGVDDEGLAASESAGSSAFGAGGAAFDRKQLVGKETVEARYIERVDDPLYELALQWVTDEQEMREVFYESNDRRDRVAREVLNAQLRAEKLKRFDLNGDGEIDEFEGEIKNRPRFEQSIMGQKTLDRFDVNRDMRIDAREQEALEAHYRSEIQRKLDALLPKYDQNGDGQLSREERIAYHTDVISQAATPTEPVAEVDEDARQLTWLTYRLDMNGDMRVDLEDTRLFLHHLARGSVIADLDRDGRVGLSDYDTHRDWSYEFERLVADSP